MPRLQVLRLLYLVNNSLVVSFTSRPTYEEASLTSSHVGGGQGDGLNVLLSIFMTSSGEVRDQAVWTFGNISADCDDCRRATRNSGILEHLLSMFFCCNI
uniref:Armadillo repeat-containing domain-containing protein n=1 Tax=Acrobeloides nanus TaxID=290746 RepID=A0A914D0G4_9BILA